MSTIEELRRTMSQHADDLHDDATHLRAAAVRRRGQQVRRQRRIGVAAAAAVVLAGVTAVALPGDHSPQPANRHLLGMEAPATMTSLGYTYDFSRGIEGKSGRTTVKVPASDQAQLLTWADRGVGTIRVFTADNRTIVSRGDFRDFLVIPPGFGGTWTLEGTAGTTAAAVYQVDPTQPPDGYTKGGITYRADVLDRTLLTADIGDPGQAELEGTVTLPAGRVGVGSFCTGGTEKTWVHFKVSHGVGSFGQNCSGPVFDPGGNLESSYRTAGRDSTVRIWATEGEHGPPSTSPDLRLGYGFYSLSKDTLAVAGYEVDQQVEYDGHTWGMARSIDSRPGDRTVFWASANRGDQELVVAVFSHTGGPVYTSLAGVDGAAFSGAGLGGSTTLGITVPGDPASELTIRGKVKPNARLGLVFYNRY